MGRAFKRGVKIIVVWEIAMALTGALIAAHYVARSLQAVALAAVVSADAPIWAREIQHERAIPGFYCHFIVHRKMCL